MLNFIKSLFKNDSYENLDAVAFMDKLKGTPNAVVLDVRTPAEVATGKLEAAINIDVQSTDFSNLVSGLDKEKPYFVYCRSGVRSANACRKMQEMGFNRLYNLSGGYLALG